MGNKLTKMIESILFLVGILSLGQFFHKIIMAIYELFFMKSKNLAKTYGKGSTVIITGGSDGIGFEYALNFAKNGFNLVLIAKSAEKLKKRAEQLILLYPTIEIQTIATDFSESVSLEYYQKIFESIQSQNVSILVNNLGIDAGTLLNTPLEKIRDCLVVNVTPAFMITKLFIDKFKPTQNNRKAVINMSNHCHELEVSDKSIYNSTKHAIQMFSVGENMHFKSKGTDFLCVKPVNCTTGMNDYRPSDFLTSTTKEVVKGALKA